MARAADRLGPPRHQTTSDSSASSLYASSEHKQTLLQRFKQRFIYGTPHYALLAGDAGMQLAEQVGDLLGKKVPANPPRFSNNETRVVVPTEVATKDVYVIQSTDTNPDTALTNLRLLEEGAKGVGVNRITVILTHLPYSRQDRREQAGAPEAGRLSGQEIFAAGSHNPYKSRFNPFKQNHETKLTAKTTLLVVDVHSENPLEIITRDSKFQWANLDSAVVLAPKISQVIQEGELDAVVAFPDKGAAKRYKNYANLFGGGIENAAVVQKERDEVKNNVVTIANNQEDLSQKVAGRDALLIDDIIDSGGTTLQAAQLLKTQGARSVTVIATHGIFSGSALEKMMDDAIDRIIVTDSITPREDVLMHPKIDIVSLSPLLAETIRRIEARESILDLTKKMSLGLEKSYMRWGKINRYRRLSANSAAH